MLMKMMDLEHKEMNWTFGLQKRSSVGAHFCKLQEILWLSTYTSFNYFPLVNFSEHQNAQG
jgi:hypothetical protein